MLSEVVDGSRSFGDISESLSTSIIPHQGGVIWEAATLAREIKTYTVPVLADSLAIYTIGAEGRSAEGDSCTLRDTFGVSGGQWEVLVTFLNTTGITPHNQEVYVQREGEEKRERYGFITDRDVRSWLTADDQSRTIEKKLRMVFAAQIRTLETPIKISKGMLSQIDQSIAEKKRSPKQIELLRKRHGLLMSIERQEALVSYARQFVLRVFSASIPKTEKQQEQKAQDQEEHHVSEHNQFQEIVIYEKAA